MPKLLNGLNLNQLQAVTSSSSIILCLAGAGSGKTTVLTRRIAHLHQEHRVGTSNMLALTFTRLAGKEMKERVIKLIGEQEGKKLFCNTFHAFAVYVLKEWGHLLGIEKNFTIYDQDDRQAILEKIIEDFGKRTTLKKVLNRFENSEDVQGERIMFPEECRVLEEYGFRLKQNNAVDLDRLIDLVNLLWNSHPNVLQHYQHMYSHIFVDEFQDTNDEQMIMIKMLNPKNLFIVGDDFQAIYGWRKARVEYIIEFPRNYPQCEVIKLQDNYRSTHTIVQAANNLISHNKNQTEKKLIAHKDGVDVSVYHLKNEEDERKLIATFIHERTDYSYEATEEGLEYRDFAVLARTNAQIDSLKGYLDYMGIPSVKIAGTDDPFKKRDVKQVIAWLDFLHNARDTVNLKKCLNYPRSYVTEDRLITAEMHALANDMSLYQVIEENYYLYREQSIYKGFIDDLRNMENELQELEEHTPSNYLKALVEVLGIESYYRTNNLTNRLQGFDQAFKYMQSWEKSKKELGEDYGLSSFLRWLKHRDMQERLTEEKDAVKLMTIHASKGLEFPIVFVIGLNQGIFPSKRSHDAEEERRLAYVAFTRAKEQLILTRQEKVEQWNRELIEAFPSTYLQEIKGQSDVCAL